MAKNKSFADKIATRSDQLICNCGSVIKMKTVFRNNKLQHYAECQGCKKTARKPNLLMER